MTNGNIYQTHTLTLTDRSHRVVTIAVPNASRQPAVPVIGPVLGDRASLILVRAIAPEDFHRLALAVLDTPEFDSLLFLYREEDGVEKGVTVYVLAPHPR